MFWIGFKYFTSSMQRSRLKNVLRLTTISLAISVGSLVLSISMIRGFYKEVMSKSLKVHGHGYILSGDLPDINQDRKIPKTLFEKALAKIHFNEVPRLLRVVDTTDSQAAIIKNNVNQAVIIRGMSNDDLTYVMGDYINAGEVKVDIIGDRYPIVVGYKLAKKFNLSPGGKIDLTFVSSNKEDVDIDNVKCEVAGIFKVGLYEIDRNMIFCASDLIHKYGHTYAKNKIMYIDNPDKVDEYVDLVRKIDEKIEVETWKESYAHIQEMFANNVRFVSIIIGMFVLSAIIQSISSLWILLSDRSYDISVFTMLGMSPYQKYNIFITYGTLISITNTFFGIITGIGLSLAYPYLRDTLKEIAGITLFDPNAFWIQTFDPQLLFWDIVVIGGCTLMVMILSMMIGSYFVLRTEISEGVKN
jgi:lipoprotein-releasing system permease protein